MPLCTLLLLCEYHVFFSSIFSDVPLRYRHRRVKGGKDMYLSALVSCVDMLARSSRVGCIYC